MEVLPKDTLVVPKRHSQVASYWFSQAGSHLIDLEIADPSRRHPIRNDQCFVNFMMQLVWPRVERIRSLHLSFREIYDICCLLQRDDKYEFPHYAWAFPNLEYLTLQLEMDGMLESPVHTIQSMPKLHTVVLKNAYALDIHLPWAQLTSLTIDAIEGSLFRLLMARCPILETGCFSIYADGDIEEELPIGDITLTRLTTFTIHFLGAYDLSILDDIHLPALADFTLFLADPACDFDWMMAPEHLFRQLAPITTLSLGKHIAPPDMIRIIHQTKNVMTFEVEVEDGHGELFKALTIGPELGGEDALLPKLSAMRVRPCPRDGSEPFAVVAFVDMVASRSPSGADALDVEPLREVSLGIPGSLNTLKGDMDTVLEGWEHKTDMPRIRYELCR